MNLRPDFTVQEYAYLRMIYLEQNETKRRTMKISQSNLLWTKN